MSAEHRLIDYLADISQAASDALVFVEGMSKTDFLDDKRTQQAVILNLLIIGEAATKIMENHADFSKVHDYVPWRSMRGMRNRIAHGYFDIDLEVVWETTQISLTELVDVKNLPLVKVNPKILGNKP